MDARFGVEWTAAELEQARSMVARMSNAQYDACASNGNGDNITRHDRIVRELRTWFPWRTMRQVIDLYVDLVVEMAQAAAQPHDGYAGAVVNPSFEHVNNNSGMPPEAAMNVDVGMNYGSAGMVLGGAPMEETVEQAPPPAPMVVNGNDGEEVNQVQQAAPNTGRFWNTDEHRLFLRGLRVYGRGDWKNISKYFVTTKTPVQVSSHAQKYFRRLRSATAKHRYSINDVDLYEADPWGVAMDNNNNNFDAAMNNVAQFWVPLLYNPQIQQQVVQMQIQAQQRWNDQQMMMDAAAAYQQQQGATYAAPAEQWMNQSNSMF